MANVDVLLGLEVRATVRDVLDRGAEPDTALIPVHPLLSVLPASSGVPEMANLGPDDQGLLAVRVLQDGGWASVSDSDSLLALFDDRGGLIRDYRHIWFEGKTRFEHHWIDMHETLQITEGPWAGALAFISNVSEEWGGPEEDWLRGELR